MSENKKMTVAEALEEGRSLPFALVRTLSEVHLGENTRQVDPEELLEARFFDGDREIRVFRRGEALEAACVERSDREYTEEYRLINGFGWSLTVCRMLAEDDDGQAYIKTTRLVDWKGEKEHG